MFKFVSSFLDPNNTSRLNQVGIFIVRLAAGMFIAAFDGWPKFLQGIAYILQKATWPLRISLEMLGPAFPALSAFAAMITFPLGGLFVAAEFLMRSASLDLLGSLLVAVYGNLQRGRDNQIAMLFRRCAVDNEE